MAYKREVGSVFFIIAHHSIIAISGSDSLIFLILVAELSFINPELGFIAFSGQNIFHLPAINRKVSFPT